MIKIILLSDAPQYFWQEFMKKLLVVILMVLYMAGAVGATVHIHYCMGEVADFSLTHKEEDRCKKCGMKKAERNKGCCKDESKTLKINDHKLSKATSDPAYHSIDLRVQPVYFTAAQTIPVYEQYRATVYIPPLVCQTCPVYIKIRNFRI